MTDKEQIIIDVDEYFKIVTDDWGRPVTYVVNHNDLRDEIITLNKEFARKTQKCKELKEYIQANQPTGICETCTAKALLENDKYRQSLEEIEEYLDAQQKYFDGEDYHNLLDIINKAKGEL